MAITTRRRGGLRLALLLLMAAAAIAVIVLFKEKPDETPGTRTQVPEMSAAELANATAADFRREIRQRAALDACYKKIGDNLDAYPRELLVLALKNSEAAQFVADYPERIGRRYTAGKIDVSGELKDGELPYFIQWDERWGYAAYGSGIMGLSGCGPTCLAMVAAGLTGNAAANPLAVADYSSAQGWYVEGYGTEWELMRSGAAYFGLRWRELPLDADRMCAALDAGQPIIASMGPGDFTDSGHYIVLRGYTSDGFRVLDPNSPDNTELVWPYSRIKDQIMNLWAYSV